MTGETFGQMLRLFRERQDGHVQGNRFTSERRCLSQNQLAHRCEIDVSYINRLERGLSTDPRAESSQPSRAIVESLACGLRLSPLDRDRLLIAAGYWPWPDQAEDVERALAAVHGDFYGERRRTG